MLVERKESLAGSAGSRGAELARRPFACVSCPTALAQIRQPGKDLLIWQRRMDDDVVAEIANLILDEVDDLVLASAVDTLDGALADTMADAGYPATPALRRDIVMLARQHAALVDDSEVRIRLEVVETDACRKFHADYVKLRTITTYMGQGTQWIESGSPDDADAIQQLRAGDIAMFKGRLWQESPAILHRSPPIGERWEQRLVLVIDPTPLEEELIIRLEGNCA